LRIVLVNNYARVTGGADLHCLEITEGLRERGHQVAWLSTRSADNLESEGIFIERVVGADNREHLSPAAKIRAARRAIWNPAAAQAMHRLVMEFRPDITHFHKSYVQLSVAPVVVAKRLKLPVVQTVHDYEFLSASPLDSTGGHWDRDESKLSYRALNSSTFMARRHVHRPRVDRWIAVSRAVAEIHRNVGGIESEVIPNFTSVAASTPPDFGSREGVVFVGRLAPEKGIEFVIDAARALPGTKFTIAGDGPLASLVERAAGELTNLEHVGFVGQKEARNLMRSAVACLIPSVWQEPGPLSCLEAMAEGTPVICFSFGGLAEYVADSSAGIVCGSPDSDSLVQAIRPLEADRDRWSPLSENGVSGIRERHTRPVYLDRLEAVYESAISGNRP